MPDRQSSVASGRAKSSCGGFAFFTNSGVVVNTTEIKQKVLKAIEARRADIEAIAQAILKEPELGYKEVKTSAKVRVAFDALGLEYTTGWGITGIKARIKGGKPGKTVAVIGELDAVICKNSPYAAPSGACLLYTSPSPRD